MIEHGIVALKAPRLCYSVPASSLASSGNELSGSLEDAGCTALLDCIRENPCTLAMGAEDSCYDGTCADDFEQYGQQGGRALSLLLTAGACINGPGQGCPCNDPNNCCSTENPCRTGLREVLWTLIRS